jgi:hypothetical protein
VKVVPGTFSEAVTITTGGLAVSAGAATISVEIKTGGLLVFAGGATTTDTGLMVLTGDVTLSDGDLDVSGTGTFGEAVTITTGGLAVSGRSATIGVEIKTGGLWSLPVVLHYHYRFNEEICWGRYVVSDLGIECWNIR